MPLTGERVALMSIHPQFADAILDGRKAIEFRKRRLAPDVRRVLIYATSPLSRIIGEFTIGDTVEGAVHDIRREYGHTGIISAPNFHRHYAGKAKAVALIVTQPRRFRTAVALNELHPGPRSPRASCTWRAALSLVQEIERRGAAGRH